MIEHWLNIAYLFLDGTTHFQTLAFTNSNSCISAAEYYIRFAESLGVITIATCKAIVFA